METHSGSLRVLEHCGLFFTQSEPPPPLALHCGCFSPSAPGQEAAWLSGKQCAFSLNHLYFCNAPVPVLYSLPCLPEG